MICDIQNALNTYSDLDFLIPKGVQSADEVPKRFVYADNVLGGLETRTAVQCGSLKGLSRLGHGTLQGRARTDFGLHRC